jgi:DtxR family Mn-dependent transcriptional regulator
MLTSSEENYLKAIYKIYERTRTHVSTNAIAQAVHTAPASVTDMLIKLANKELIEYKPYKGCVLSQNGMDTAKKLIRKHRLWETFLCKALDFDWDEVDEIAEQLEHIHSEKLFDRLDEFLGSPKYDPHGDPIPDKSGKFKLRQQQRLSSLKAGELCRVVGVKITDKEFLQNLDRLMISINTDLEVLEIFENDHSMKIKTAQESFTVSKSLSDEILVQRQ